MATNLALDDHLLVQAQKIGKFRTKKETVNFILEDYIKRMRQKNILDLFGTIQYDETYDYKKSRDPR